MAGHNFIRNEVFDENVDRLNELTRFVITERKTAEYNARITALEAERERLRNVAQRDEAAINVVDTRLRNAREDKCQFEIAAKAEIGSTVTLRNGKLWGRKRKRAL